MRETPTHETHDRPDDAATAVAAARPPVRDLPDGLRRSALELGEAHRRWLADATHWLASRPPLEDGLFWPLLGSYRLLVLRALPSAADVAWRWAAEEMCRLAVVGEARYALDDVAGFVNRYRSLVGELVDALVAMDFDMARPPTACCWLCDSLPIAGPVVAGRILARQYHHLSDLEDDVAAEMERSCPGDDQRRLASRLLYGDNAVVPAVETALLVSLGAAIEVMEMEAGEAADAAQEDGVPR